MVSFDGVAIDRKSRFSLGSFIFRRWRILSNRPRSWLKVITMLLHTNRTRLSCSLQRVSNCPRCRGCSRILDVVPYTFLLLLSLPLFPSSIPVCLTILFRNIIRIPRSRFPRRYSARKSVSLRPRNFTTEMFFPRRPEISRALALST